MAELLRSIAGRLREFVGNRRSAPRRVARVPVSVSLVELKGAGGVQPASGESRLPTVEGHTRDLSETGVGLVLPVIRVGERYLTGEGRRLRVVLELPTGPLVIQAVPVRYERLEDGGPDAGYIVGARITSIDAIDRSRLGESLKRKG